MNFDIANLNSVSVCLPLKPPHSVRWFQSRTKSIFVRCEKLSSDTTEATSDTTEHHQI
nr:MAG TPA: hypothetical protein [Caudoviricetes sp.]DAY41085.1 MAG TPA: hypothetical protein [Caudoviricetes sp.]